MTAEATRRRETALTWERKKDFRAKDGAPRHLAFRQAEWGGSQGTVRRTKQRAEVWGQG